MQIGLKKHQKSALSAPLRMMQIRCQKGASTKMHKCLVGKVV